MTETYKPWEGDGGPANSSPETDTTKKEAAPLNQDDAIILKNTKDEFERSPVPPATYDVRVEKCEFGFNKKNKQQISIQFRIKGPSQINRVLFLKLARGNDFAPIMLKKFLSRAQKVDAKGEYHSLIEQVNVEEKFDEKAFCDKAIAIGAECKVIAAYGKPYKNNEGQMVTPNNITDILLPSTGTKFMQ